MQLVDLGRPEKEKLIVAASLGLIAIVFLWWTFPQVGGGTRPPHDRRRLNSSASSTDPQRTNGPATQEVNDWCRSRRSTYVLPQRSEARAEHVA